MQKDLGACPLGEKAAMSRKRDLRQSQICNEVEAVLGNSIICGRCRCTFPEMADKCTAPLEEPCPGFNRIDEVRRPIVARVYGFKDNQQC